MAPSKSVTSNDWQAYLEEAQQCHLPAIGDAAFAQSTFFEVGVTLQQQLCRLAVAEDSSLLPSILHAAWAIVLNLYTGKDEVSFGFGKATAGPKEPTHVQEWQLVRSSLDGTMSLAKMLDAAQELYTTLMQYSENDGNGDATALHLARKEICNSTILLWEGSGLDSVKLGRGMPNKILSQLKTSVSYSKDKRSYESDESN